MYRICFERKAREQLDNCCNDYGEEISADLWKWLEGLAESAEAKALDSCSSDFVEFLDNLTSDLEKSDLPFSIKKWKRENFLTKIKAVLVLIRQRRPPWQLRHAYRSIQVFYRPVEVHAICEIDNVQKKLIVRKFIDLPGQ